MPTIKIEPKEPMVRHSYRIKVANREHLTRYAAMLAPTLGFTPKADTILDRLIEKFLVKDPDYIAWCAQPQPTDV